MHPAGSTLPEFDDLRFDADARGQTEPDRAGQRAHGDGGSVAATDHHIARRGSDLGIATDTPDGLFVPVLRNVGRRDAADLRRGLERMKVDVRARSVPREELVGATITLSNFGMFGGRHAPMVILPPQVAIVGAGRVRDDLRILGGAIRITRVLPLSLTFDHRVVMGGEAARFLAALVANLERHD